MERNGGAALIVAPDAPPAGAWRRLLAMTRDPASLVIGETPVTVPVALASMPEAIHVAVVDADVAGSLLKVVKGVYAPAITRNTEWPESVRAELSAHAHLYLAGLTERAHELRGETVLYVPDEPELAFSVSAAARETAREEMARGVERASLDGELTRRLESEVIRWTRRIREVVRETDAAGRNVSNESVSLGLAKEDASDGPLAEIAFWHARARDLAGIAHQIDDAGVASVVAVLRKARSTYLDPFSELRGIVASELAAAKDNARFLNALVPPCEALAKARVEEVASLVPGISHRVRLVWNAAEKYDRGRVFGLLRKISNEVIRRCAKDVSVHDIMDGNVAHAVDALHASIEACDAWKTSFEFTRAAVNKRHADDSSKRWPWPPSSLFARLDAFEQRCKDLLDVCDAQAQFAPRRPPPVFGGATGSDIAKRFADIRDAFRSVAGALRANGARAALDVSAASWRDDFDVFASGVKDLEVRFQNAMTAACESARADLVGFVERVDELRVMSVGDGSSPIGRCVDRLTSELFAAFADELAATKKHFDTHRENPPVHPSEPRRAGAASWAYTQHARLKGPWDTLEAAAAAWAAERDAAARGDEKSFSSRNVEEDGAARSGGANLRRELDALRLAYDAALPQFEKYANDQYTAWVAHVERAVAPSVTQRLENRLLAVAADDGEDEENEKSGRVLLRAHFDEELLVCLAETKHFERMYFQIPHVCAELGGSREKYRVMREDVLGLVAAYNDVMLRLDADERRLFRDRLGALDKKIAPGLQKVNWMSSKSVLDFYMTESLKQVSDVKAQVDTFKACIDAVREKCAKMGKTSLVSLTKKRVYRESEFQQAQETRLAEARKAFGELRAEMEDVLKKTFRAIFSRDSPKVQREWLSLLRRVDSLMLEALRNAVKTSLRSLSRALHGDPKTKETAPLFGVAAILRGDKRVELKPAVADIRAVLHDTCRALVAATEAVDRLGPADDAWDENESDEGESEDPKRATSGRRLDAGTFFEIISADETETLARVVAVDDGASGVVDEAARFVSRWNTSYGFVWERDKESTLAAYAAANHPLSTFESDIQKFKDLAEEIRAEAHTEHMLFLRVDCEPLVDAAERHCETWRARYLELLNDQARTRLFSLCEYFETGAEALRSPPAALEQLADKVALHGRLLAEREETHASFVPLRAQYATLEKFEAASATPAELAKLAKLDGAWTSFVEMLGETEVSLEEYKEGFRDELTRMVDKLVSDADEFVTTFAATAPKSVADAVTHGALDAARAALVSFDASATSLRAREAEVRKGLGIFGTAPPRLGSIGRVETEMQNLRALWDLIAQWLSEYDVWSLSKFRDLRVEEMEMSAQTINKNVVKLGKKVLGDADTSAGGVEWGAWRSLKDTIDGFKKTIPRIMDLRNPAICDRHWEQVMRKCGETFNPHGDDFTLGRVTELKLHLHDGFIAELSSNATKEFAIETSLATIQETWTQLKLDMVPYKEGRDVYKLRGTEEVYAALEDNIVTLSTMKASKFFTVFEQPITGWERKLLLVSETLDLVTKVQTAWMYLENIFVGSEDIQKQLPLESVAFDDVDAAFIAEMRAMRSADSAVAACAGSAPDAASPVSEKTLDAFARMDEKLERIQKSLEAYLERKRQRFPRFYFISGADLLEILGQAADPRNVQPHFKGMFEGVEKLEMHRPGEGGRRNYASTGMHSPDGERLSFDEEVPTHGRPEEWLNEVERAMRRACKSSLRETLEQSKGMKKEKWVKQFPGQMIISAGCVVWTAECEKALADKDNAKAAVRMLKKKWVSYLNKLVTLTRSELDKVNRKKVVALITIEVHARDSIEKLSKSGCEAVTDFEWVSQLRFYWDHEKDDCVVKQVLSEFSYGYEYQGNNGRLVVTPLTDRCYMTLGAAMFTRRGGNPLGPAGTGKTETVKDFGKALARYVIVFNCSDGVDYKMTAKMFSGLAQTGAWACLDEFNRISVEVLSVVATQISVIMAAVKKRAETFFFEGQNIRLIPSCGVFVTMNPGYAGRAELPDNLKAIVRPVSMMVPDFSLIAEIMMFAEGFSSAKSLAKKMVAIMELSQQQLSKQDHYDYTLRSFVIPISRAAGAHKRVDPEGSEEAILYRTMQDLITPKLVYLDIPLFRALLGDLFPGVDQPPDAGGKLRAMLEHKCVELGLQVVDDWIVKIIQIFDCKVARHGNMIVGKTGAGKTAAWKVLKAAMAQLCEDGAGNGEFQKVEVYTINPLALSNDEMYGCFDPASHEWTDGILARVMRNICKDESPDQKWMLFDGPVDTLWIESMNTLLDDNKLLTLLSGERIMMSPQVSILFEVEDLSQASPATVSRAGMIYLNVEDLGWWPFANSWLAGLEQRHNTDGKGDAALKPAVHALLTKWMESALEFKRLKCAELVETDKLAAVRQFTTLFDALKQDPSGSGLDPSTYPADDPKAYLAMVEKNFVYALTWSVGASLDNESRKKFDMFVRDLDSSVPSKDTVYEYFVDAKTRDWAPWESRLAAYKPPEDTPLFRIMVPTVDTLRTKTVALTLAAAHAHVLVVGRAGVGKSMVATKCLEELPDGYSSCVVNFSAQTSSNSLQDIIEGKLEKRSKGTFAPPGGKRMVVLCDDFNMPRKSAFGFMPPLELLKLWANNGFWYDRSKQEVKHIRDIQLMASMAPPGGGRNAFSQRIMSVFATLNMTNPSDAQLHRIYATLLNHHLRDFDDSLKPLGDPIVKATVELYASIAKELLPTPRKSHYLFNTRDLAKVIQGTMQTTRRYYAEKDQILQLWCHECFRVFGDRMWDPDDTAWLKNQLDQKLLHVLGSSWETLFEPFYGECPPFVSFMRADVDDPPYEAAVDPRRLKDSLTEKLEEYAVEPGNAPMDLVLFRDALTHICRVHRVLCQPRGNALLVGMGGSGRKSLARLATYVAKLKCFSVEITKNYRLAEFREDLKELFRQTGVADKPTVFLFDETQIVVETFLEDINNVLTSGEVPNLFVKDEMSGLCEDVRVDAKRAGAGETQDELYAFFLGRVIKNLHIVLCMSPIGDGFRERCRMFPGLVNCCTIDWFTEWPSDALQEVAKKQMESEREMDDEVKESLCKVFATCHRSTTEKSGEMLAALKRKNYVTPTNYLEFVNGYRALLTEKRKQISGMANKLRGGTLKLDETSVQVGEMTVVAQEKQVVVAAAKTECEELLVTIVADKRVADDQEKRVSAEAAKIGRDAEEANAIAAECQAGLDQAMPALNAAQAALNVLTKKDMSELKAYSKPPALVELCLKGVMTVLKKAPTWDAAKKTLGETQFLPSLLNFDKDKLDDALLGKIKKYVNDPEYTPEKIGAVSGAAKGLCQWVHAMFIYGNIAKEVAPKRAKLKAAQEALKKKQAALKEAEQKLQVVLDKVQALKDTYETSTSKKKALEDELADLEAKLQRAEKLVHGLAGEKTRWEQSIGRYEEQIEALPGDVVIAAAFMSYAGPFPSEYRDALVAKIWLPQVEALGIPASPAFDFALFLANPSDVRDWNIDGLPADAFSTENGVVVTRGNRWPLLIDPQGQGNKWIKTMEKPRGLKVVTLNMPDMVRRMENAIQFGDPVLIQDVQEEIDPILEPVLSKSFVKKGNSLAVKLGEKEVDYSPDFKLYLTSKLTNPHYTPEVSTKVTIVNFAVQEQGLEAQLRDVVVRKERPDLDRQKNDLVKRVAEGTRAVAELEDQLLDLLSNATGSLLDNIELINTLNESKVASDEVTESLAVAEKTRKKIESASALYRPCSVRAAILYFVLYDLAEVDPMYQFSLDAYIDLFVLSIRSAPRSARLDERIRSLNEFHTYATYKYTSRGLFEAHKLLLSLQMCVRILSSDGKMNDVEWRFFLRGGAVLDRSDQSPNPAPDWISELAWDNVVELEHQVPHFSGLTAHFERNVVDWEDWYRESEPENPDAPTRLPGDWETKCDELQRMLLVRCLRMDRVEKAAMAYVANVLGRKYVEPPTLDLAETLADSTPTAPLIFVLSPGADPTANLKQLARARGIADRFFSVALGQGQGPVATKLIEDATRDGNWVFLANCHLMLSWLPELQKIVERFEDATPHERFRLWLSSNPTPHFPLAILQRGLKMTTEPPKGLRANLARLYQTCVTEESFAECRSSAKYAKLLFSLTYFHAVMLERRKFRELGINVPYDFNDTDYSVSDDVLKAYLDAYEETPWDALKYLIGEANYGGRVTDEIDRRVLSGYLNQYFCEDALRVPNFPLSALEEYYVPQEGPLSSYREYIATLPVSDHPEAFGQHPNADISYMITDSVVTLESCLALQPKRGAAGGGGGGAAEALVDALIDDMLASTPRPFDHEQLMKDKKDDPSPLHVTLFQEVERYNVLLANMRSTLELLKKGIKGLVVMSADLDAVFEALANNKVPALYLKAYPSLKPLGSWTRDLTARLDQIRDWVSGTYPGVYWLAGFTYPSCFLTAVLQTTARNNRIPIDTLGFEYRVMTQEEKDLEKEAPDEGVYVKGMYLEGAGWDMNALCLCEPHPMDLVVDMPIVHFRPAETKSVGDGKKEKKREKKQGTYQCPLYMYPVRTGSRERPSFMIMVDLKSGAGDSDFWIKRGTALLLSLAN